MKVLALALKDLTRSFRSLFLMGMAVAVPLLLTGLMYLAFGGIARGETTLPVVNLGVVNLDTLPAGAPLEASLGDSVRALFSDAGTASWIVARDYADEAAARSALDAQEISAAVIVPDGFTQTYLATGTPLAITVLQDPTLSIGPGVVRDMVEGLLEGVMSGSVAFETLSAQVGAAPAAALMERYGEAYTAYQQSQYQDSGSAPVLLIDSRTGGEATNLVVQIMAPILAGQMIFFAFFTAAYAMMSIVQESEEGTLPRLFATPTPRSTLLAGKYLAVAITVLLQGLVLVLAGRILFGITWGSPGAVALALLGQVAGAVGLGVLLISFVRNTRQGGMIFGGVLTALGMLSGIFTTNVEMPASVQALSAFTPQGWVLRIWRAAGEGRPLPDVVQPLLVVLGVGGVMFAAGAVLFRRRYARVVEG